jgi:hypothetical protein
MNRIIQWHLLRDEGYGKRALLASGIVWGFLGGLAGTMTMDILLMGVLLILGQPAWMCFSIVGDTVSSFLEMFGARIAGGIPTGVIAHYLIGPFVGILFGAAVTLFSVLRKGTLKRITIAAFVYVLILSQPLLTLTPILLKMTAHQTLQWFIGSFFMHLILSLVLGLIVGYGLRLAPLATSMRLQ